MLTITARLLHGTVRAGSPDDTAMAGGTLAGEWPPSPARLFSALVAGDGTRDRCRVTDGSELAALERLRPPRVYADAPGDVVWTAIPSRFVVRDVSEPGVSQNYPARKSTEVRPGMKASPRTPLVAYVWDAEVDPAVVDALRCRAGRVGYLGCADSPVQLTVTTDGPPDVLCEWRPAAGRGVNLPVPYPGFTAGLDAAFDAWSSGQQTRRSWLTNRWERYAPVAAGPAAPAGGSGQVVWVEFDRKVDGRRALLVSRTLREAILDHVDDLCEADAGPAGRRAPWQLHGHAIPADVERPYQLARFLPLANVGHRHSDGAIHGAAIWLPPGCPADVVELVRAALFSRLRRLRAPGLDVAVAPRSGERGRWSTRPVRWSGPARRWVSATPAVAERGRRGGQSRDDVRRWFVNAGHPAPSRVRVSPVPTAPGVVRLRSSEVHRAGKDRHPYVWLDVEFDEPATGPLCVGRSRSIGMGLLAPVAEPEDAARDTGEAVPT